MDSLFAAENSLYVCTVLYSQKFLPGEYFCQPCHLLSLAIFFFFFILKIFALAVLMLHRRYGDHYHISLFHCDIVILKMQSLTYVAGLYEIST